MEPKQILCYGDSNTWGCIPISNGRYPRAARWTGVMAERLGSGYAVIEEGQNGRTTVWEDPLGIDRNGLQYLPACLQSHKPLDLVILMLGTNDLKARFALTAYDIAAGAERLVQVVQQSGCGVNGGQPAILLTAPPVIRPQGDFTEIFIGGEEKSRGLAARYAAVAQRNGCTFLDLTQVIQVDLSDGIHYSAESHRQLGIALAGCVQSIFSAD